MSKEEQSFFDMLLTKEEGSTKEGLVDVVKEVLVDVVKEVVEEETIPGQGGEEEIEPGASEEFFKGSIVMCFILVQKVSYPWINRVYQ